MDDGGLLMLAVLRGKARDETANLALVDYILDHLPENGVRFRVEGKLKIHYAAINVTRETRVQPPPDGGRPVPTQCLKIECHHSRGKKGTRSMQTVVRLSEPRLAHSIQQLLRVVRS